MKHLVSIHAAQHVVCMFNKVTTLLLNGCIEAPIHRDTHGEMYEFSVFTKEFFMPSMARTTMFHHLYEYHLYG